MSDSRLYFNYMWAEIHMRTAKVVRRAEWPVGKTIYYDTDGDGIPDELDVSHPDFLANAKENYAKYKAGVRIAQDGEVLPAAYVTQADSLANDWYIVE